MGFDIHQFMLALILAMDILFMQYLMGILIKGTDWEIYFEWW